MTGAALNWKPILRPLDFQPVYHQGQQMWLLRDPLELTAYQLIVPAALAPMLAFCDGTRTVHEVYHAFCRFVGAPVDYDIITSTLATLDEACLLENERSRAARQSHLEAFRAQLFRAPTLAGLSYPADPDELAALFAAYSQGDNLNGWGQWRGRGVISPHIDYQRGGLVYAKVWQRAVAAAQEADLVLMFGTDHNGSNGRITLTRQPYATPYGVIPTDTGLVDKLAAAIGPEEAFAEEIHHRKEHSVELSAVWLHHANREPCPMIPILCGSFHGYVSNGHHPADDGKLNAFVETLRVETAGKKVLAVASVDFAHVGPNFGDEFKMDPGRRAQLRAQDESLIEAISQGDDARFYREIAAVQDANRICGFSSIYLMLRYLGETNGRMVAYDHCPADPGDTSLVSICGMLLD
jgi:AmmeMemoRadiSam system protein B